MSCISFKINGKPYTVCTGDIPADTSLNTYLRNHAQLSGTKLMCNEGGCGACIVTLKRVHPVTNKLETIAVNSCLMALYACHNDDIITVEGLGNSKDGYLPEQTRLIQKNGSQCGYCTPGMIMNMHSLLESDKGTLTMAKVENSFGGNICRCTGYRSILDAFKSLAVDADSSLCHDIEDLPQLHSNCNLVCDKIMKESLHLTFKDGNEWHKVYTIAQVLQTLKDSTLQPYILLAGNTARGVHPQRAVPKLFIDINDVSDLRGHSIIDNELVIGATTSLNETIKIFESVSQTPGFEYCSSLAQHIDKIANVPVRNIGTIGGNLSIKHQHNSFPSDVFIMLEAAGAKLTIIDATTNTRSFMEVAEFLTMDMLKKLIVNVKLPMLDKTLFKFKSYKITVRAQNAHAYVNAGFLLKFKSNLVESARICFGGINPKFIHASDTETFLRGKNLYSNETLQLAIQILKSELHPDEVITDASPQYRKLLAVSLFYKFVLKTCNINLVQAEHRSGGDVLERPLSSGTQTYDTQKDKFPLTEPVVKLEGLAQVSGTAKYTNDIPHFINELWAAFVPATKVHSKIEKIDASEALKIPGVRHFFSALDIPGNNNFTPTSSPLLGIVEEEKIFVEHKGEVLFYGQPVGIILAETPALANIAATKVTVSYLENDSYVAIARNLFSPWIGEKTTTPTVLDLFDSNGKNQRIATGTTDSQVPGATKTIKGRIEIAGQFHMSMEPQTAICIPTESGMLVHSSTQWTDITQTAIAQCLNVQENSIHVEVKRVGGGFGSKISRSCQIACACALACHLTDVPVRFVMSIESNMNVCGKRNGMIGEYTIDVDGNGKIMKLAGETAHDMGCSLNETPRVVADIGYPNCYDASTWKMSNQLIKTDAPSHTWCRAPGSMECVSMAETMMEHIAKVTGKDPLAVRVANLPPDSKMRDLLPKFVIDVDYNDRKETIDDFNKKNRWTKKGIAISVMKFPFFYFDTTTAYVCVYHDDGTVVVKHSGVEIGQGMNTKVTQVAAHTLGIPHTFVKVGSTDNIIGANCAVTGGSVTSEIICFTVMKACEEILSRLKPLRDANKNAQWTDLTKAAYKNQIGMSVVYTTKAADLKPYDVFGLACAEVETDLLTGNILVHRVDILEDAGESLNPLIDIGQVEGAFVMGMGYWLTEALVYDRMNGELMTNRTWTYKPPGAKDIPIDFRVTLLQNSRNSDFILGSKAVGEPAITLAIAVNFALRNALESARSDAGIKYEPWFKLPSPVTPEVIALAAGHSTDGFTL